MRTLCIVFYGLLAIGGLLYGQTAPTPLKIEAKSTAATPAIPESKKINALSALHKRDAVDKQISDLSSQFLQMQNKAQAQATSLQKQREQADENYQTALAECKAGIDPKRWNVDDLCDVTPVPQPEEKGSADKPKAEVQAKRE